MFKIVMFFKVLALKNCSRVRCQLLVSGNIFCERFHNMVTKEYLLVRSYKRIFWVTSLSETTS